MPHRQAHWSIKPVAPEAFLHAVPEHPLLAQILYNRGVATPQQVRAFLDGEHAAVENPYKLRDMTQAVRRILKALQKQETICVYGDFDVDGVASTALLVIALQALGGCLLYTSHTRQIVEDQLRRLETKPVGEIIAPRRHIPFDGVRQRVEAGVRGDACRQALRQRGVDNGERRHQLAAAGAELALFLGVGEHQRPGGLAAGAAGRRNGDQFRLVQAKRHHRVDLGRVEAGMLVHRPDGL